MSARRGGLEIDQDLDFQRREWIAQRIGWWLMAAFLAAALLGLFGGGGPLTSATARAADGRLEVEYERFVRAGAPSEMTIRASGAAGGPGRELELRIGREYFEAVEIERIVPEPRSIAIAPEHVTLRFAADESAVVLTVSPRRAGMHATEVRAGAGAAATIGQLAYF